MLIVGEVTNDKYCNRSKDNYLQILIYFYQNRREKKNHLSNMHIISRSSNKTGNKSTQVLIRNF